MSTYSIRGEWLADYHHNKGIYKVYSSENYIAPYVSDHIKIESQKRYNIKVDYNTKNRSFDTSSYNKKSIELLEKIYGEHFYSKLIKETDNENIKNKHNDRLKGKREKH